MMNTNATNFRKNIFNLLEQTIKYNEPLTIATKDGNAVMLSESDYNSLLETLYLCSVPNLREHIFEALVTPIEECVAEEQVDW